MKVATISGRSEDGKEEELGEKGGKCLGESTDCNLPARNGQDNIEWGAVSWTIQKAKCTQKGLFSF